MATNIVMPQMGYDMREGTVVKWHKTEGDEVSRGDVLADIETDKATVEFEAYTSGVIGRIVAQEGQVVPVGELIAIITKPGEAIPDVQDVGPVTATSEPPAAVQVSSVSDDTKTNHIESRNTTLEVRASPIARRLADENGVDLTLVTGTGPSGRIVEKDVLEYTSVLSPSVQISDWILASPIARRLAREKGLNIGEISGSGPAGRVIEKDIINYQSSSTGRSNRVELSRMRQAIAKVTVDSKRDAPHFYITAEINMTKAMSFRDDLNEAAASDVRVSVNDLVIKASALALQNHKKFNASFQGDYLLLHSDINIGIAIALDSGLIVPGINNCESKTLLEIAAASKDLIERSHSGNLSNSEYSETTFSISNLGMFDVESFSAIIFPPHAAVVAVGSVKEQPVVRSGEITVAKIMKATVSTDHRVADGAEAAQFLMEIKSNLENPLKLVI
ncbi:MAG: dihydrolipoamide acetyltransferase family protein [Chloroflexota bacterium]|nr:dihydrolipoamide acetyltransferase family protein [Chloroflexota bacterium]